MTNFTVAALTYYALRSAQSMLRPQDVVTTVTDSYLSVRTVTSTYGERDLAKIVLVRPQVGTYQQVVFAARPRHG